MNRIVFAILLSIGFVVVLAAIYLVHAWYFPVGVIFYSALLDAGIAAAVALLGAFVLRRHLALSGFELGLLVVIWLLAGYAFAISGPTVLDRSLSFYILEKLQQRGGGIRTDAMERVFVDEYMPEFRLIDVRLTEQALSGTISIHDGCVRLTRRGDLLATVSHFIRTHLLPRHRLLRGT
jgi:signal transduction histidine kinase